MQVKVAVAHDHPFAIGGDGHHVGSFRIPFLLGDGDLGVGTRDPGAGDRLHRRIGSTPPRDHLKGAPLRGNHKVRAPGRNS